MKLLNIEKLVESKFLNMYKLKLINRKGNPKDYYVASRRKKEELSCVTRNHSRCDGVMVLPIYNGNEVIIVKQYRPAISDYLYELPAGIVDEDETIEEAAKREIFEETGLNSKNLEIILKPSYTSVGLCDETTAIVKMDVYGTISTEHNEDDEEIDVIKLKIDEVEQFVKNHNFSIKSALLLLYALKK